MPASIPAGTILYHGRGDDALPVALEWLAFDFEHSYLVASFWQEYYVMSYMTSRPLRLAYFDGASASTLEDGSLDVQDVLLWGRPDPDRINDEPERIKLMCEWGTRLGLDGFVRMEMHLYVPQFAAA